MGKFLAFLVLTSLLLYISRAALSVPRSHGFYRFFAWEFILALILLNLNKWFEDPLSRHQIISWILLFLSLVPLAFGVPTLVKQGKSTAKRAGEPQLLAFEKTSALVTSGIYGYIRHPLYSSLLLLAWGVFFKAPYGWGIPLVLGATIFLVLTAKADEAECIRFFGSAYSEYMKRTRMFIPFVI